jgi:hypothetical protein
MAWHGMAWHGIACNIINDDNEDDEKVIHVKISRDGGYANYYFT